ncbi:2554_t:CDS:2 [Diversispora eburnea]|uniref:2554_t:CDS:1 n=1 Tax=Diversispora eburnea TaxID=1213867 RepID=A0A9N8UY33_9GLOM|nr:2554_t:CDS:2 [Diversispora eburnea]
MSDSNVSAENVPKSKNAEKNEAKRQAKLAKFAAKQSNRR